MAYNAHNRPVQVFTEMKTSPSFTTQFVPKTNLSNENYMPKESSGNFSRHINVTGIGELILPPDRFTITIKCKATKDNLDEAKTSVTKRQDYIIQTLKNTYFKEEDFKVYESTKYQDAAVICSSEIEAHFIDIAKCLSLSNLLVEKLKSSVSVSQPLCHHSPGSLDTLRKQVGMLAIHNARQKAIEMAKVVHMSVGAPMQVEEQDFTEMTGSPTCDQEEALLSPSVRQKVDDATVRMSSKVSVCFQLKPKQKHKA